MKRTTTTLFAVITTIMLLLTASSCTTKKPEGVPTEALEQDVRELENYDSVNCYSSDYTYGTEYELVDYVLAKRQTNLENKEDIVYYDIILKNEYFEVVYQEKMTYNYYDEGGWILDEAIVVDKTVTPIRAAEEEAIFSVWNHGQLYVDATKCETPEGYSSRGQFGEYQHTSVEILDCEFDKENLTTKLNMQVECNLSKSTGYLQLNFTEDSGWHIYNVIEDDLEDYGIKNEYKLPYIITNVEHEYDKICGEYYLKTDYTENYIILDIDEEAGTITKTTKVYSSAFGGEPFSEVYTSKFNPITGGLTGKFDLEKGTWDTGFGAVYTKIS